MKLEAKQRLRAENDAVNKAKDLQKEHLDRQIENKEGQVKNLKESQPSRENRRKMNPQERFRTQKQEHQIEQQVDDLQLQKSKI